MIIVVVSDVLGEENNGTTIAAMNLIRSLKARGHEVRILCPDQKRRGTEFYYVVPTMNFGIFQPIVDKNGVVLAKGETMTIARALKDADAVHIMLPFALGRKALKIARSLGKPVTAGFHAQAENLTSHFFWLMNSHFANRLIYRNFYYHFYRYVDAIHYPTQFIRDLFEKEVGHHTKGYVISNGVDASFRPTTVERPRELTGRFVILCTGRFSKEKKQRLLLEAAGKSAHAKEIQLIFAGEGPRIKSLQRLGKKLPNAPIFRFYQHDELVKTINMADLYVHTSEIEIEAISCLEAVSCGVVPLINDSPRSATRYFALGENNLFKKNSAVDLARKIDYWIEHPEEKERLGKEYEGYARQFNFDRCMDKMEQMITQTASRKDSGRTK
jgi:1,2-diacylglycerol 3-alpha-glucosyltransferase